MATLSQFHCAPCGKTINLTTELSVDQIGRAVHHKCYTENLDALSTSANYRDELWIALYRAAMVEPEAPKISGRIDEARKEAKARIEKLSDNQSLHEGERNAIADALFALNSLSRMHESDIHAAADRTRQTLHKIEPNSARRAWDYPEFEPEMSRAESIRSAAERHMSTEMRDRAGHDITERGAAKAVKWFAELWVSGYFDCGP
jgi:hypothetical protein